jgi:hypothetical protein
VLVDELLDGELLDGDSDGVGLELDGLGDGVPVAGQVCVHGPGVFAVCPDSVEW